MEAMQVMKGRSIEKTNFAEASCCNGEPSRLIIHKLINKILIKIYIESLKTFGIILTSVRPSEYLEIRKRSNCIRSFYNKFLLSTSGNKFKIHYIV